MTYRPNPTKPNENLRKSPKIKLSEMIQNDPQWLPEPEKPPETPEKRPKTLFFGRINFGPQNRSETISCP